METIPFALVVSIHLEGENVNELLPASKRKESNSPPLKSGLFSWSLSPKNMNVNFIGNVCHVLFK